MFEFMFDVDLISFYGRRLWRNLNFQAVRNVGAIWASFSYGTSLYFRFMEPGVIVVLGGILPFGSIFIEM